MPRRKKNRDWPIIPGRTPEPGSPALFASGLAFLFWIARKRKRVPAPAA